MTIVVDSVIPVSSKFVIFVDTSNESKITQTFSTIDSFGEVIDQIIEPGVTEVPGDVTFILDDFIILVSVNDTLVEDYLVVGPGEVQISSDVLNALNSAYSDVVVDSDEVEGQIVYTLTLATSFSTHPAAARPRRLLDELLARIGNDVDDDITLEDAIESVIVTARAFAA